MKPLHRLAAGILLTTALGLGTLATAGTAAADDTGTDTSATTPGTDTTDGDTWWGNPPADGGETTARPAADTWWG